MAAQETRPAVELYNPRPIYPLAAEGSGVNPEISVKVTVDERGRVSRVEVVAIHPSSDLDGHFEAEVVDTISRWRYAPRYEDGIPVAAELQWTTPFTDPLAATGRRPSGWAWWGSLLGLPTDLGPSILELPLEQRVAILEKQVRAGLDAIGPGEVYSGSSDRFVVRTDVSQEVADTIARNLEAIYNVLDSIFAPVIPPQSDTLKVQVFAFSTPEKLAQVELSGPMAERSPPGFYSQTGFIALHLQLPTPADALAHLLHEATHAYVDRHVVRPGVNLPTWLHEGLAEYFGNSEVKRGRLQPGQSRRSQRNYIRMVQGAVLVTRSAPRAKLSLRDIRAAARRGESLTLAEMLDADQEEFYGERRRLYYSTAWMLVHFLRHGGAWEPRSFARLLFYFAEGYRGSESFEAAYGRRVSELEADFRRYLKEF